MAKWIKAPKPGFCVKRFLKTFPVTGRVREAKLYICGLGFFKAYINGQQTDDSYYQPLVTDYHTRRLPDSEEFGKSTSHRYTYHTYDVAAFLHEGENALEADVANGYYEDTDRLLCEADYSFGDAMLAYELRFTDDDGEKIVASDTDTLVREQNYRSTLYAGDRVDFTKEPETYTCSVVADEPDGVAVEPACEPDRVICEYPPVKETTIKGGRMYDFGKNHTGGLKMRVRAVKAGIRLHIRYVEILNEDGTPNDETSAWHDQNPKNGATMDIYQENHYILKEGINEITPLFSWFCYRYVIVETSDDAEIMDLSSLFISMDILADGHFSCSEEILSQTNEMFMQTLRCNLHSGLLTDCPHREKRPYTGDGQLVMKSAMYNMNMTRFYYKWFADLLDSQTPEGRIPNTAPDFGGGGGYAWGNAICFVTKYLYQFTGDRTILEKGHPAIADWIGFYERHLDEHFIVRSNDHDWMLGDWLAPEIVSSNVYYINTVCLLLALDSMIWVEEQLGRVPDSRWHEMKENVTAGINEVFFDREHLSYGNGVQGEDMFALFAGIVPKEYEASLKEKVEVHYRTETDYHLDTGIVLTPVLIEYLTENGLTDIAYKIMTATTYPSYYNLMENDTTFSEHWSKKWPDFYYGAENSRLVKGGGDLSHCHPMYGSVCAWLYERVAGLDLTGLYKKKMGVHPYFTDCLTWAKADKITPYGMAEASWKKKEDAFLLSVKVPKGMEAEVAFPLAFGKLTDAKNRMTCEPDRDGFFRFTLPAGEWTFTAGGKTNDN